jgi:tRNA wybutosine-synthesizing protein 2
MSFKQHLFERYGISPDKVPGSYQQVGDILLLKFSKSTQSAEKMAIAQAMLRYVPRAKTVCELDGIQGEFRLPKVSVVVTKLPRPKTETIHRENGVAFKLDVRKVMFSKGNVSERQRIIPNIQPGEVIVDMFAGIGYFSIGVARFSPCSMVYAMEKNPAAFFYLKQNIRMNRIDKVKAIRGDCRKIKLREKADRIIMGYFPETQKFLPAAFGFLNDCGVLHYHNIYPEESLWHVPLEELGEYAEKAGYKVKSVLEQRVVKSYAPGVQHAVVDVSVERMK